LKTDGFYCKIHASQTIVIILINTSTSVSDKLNEIHTFNFRNKQAENIEASA